MARLNQIEIRESEMTYTNQRDWFFRPTGHHVCELLLHFLPRDFVLDGSSKFCAVFGPREDERGVTYEILGVRVYCIDDFDVESYMSRPIEEQQEVILDVLTDSMVNVARTTGADINTIREAASAVRANLFKAEIPVKKLDRSTRDRRLRVRVFRMLGPANGETWEARIYSKDGTMVAVEPITDSRDCIDRTDQYSASKWSGSSFEIIYNRLKRTEFSLDISKYQND